MTTWIVLGILGWVLIGILNFGATVAYFDRSFPRIWKPGKNLGFACFMAIGGLFSFPAVLLGQGFFQHGLKFNPYKDER